MHEPRTPEDVAYERGYEAFYAGDHEDDKPFTFFEDGDLYVAWEDGYYDAVEGRA